MEHEDRLARLERLVERLIEHVEGSLGFKVRSPDDDTGDATPAHETEAAGSDQGGFDEEPIETPAVNASSDPTTLPPDDLALPPQDDPMAKLNVQNGPAQPDPNVPAA